MADFWVSVAGSHRSEWVMSESTEFPDISTTSEPCCAVYWTVDPTSAASDPGQDCYQVTVNIELDGDGVDLSPRKEKSGKLRPAHQVARRNARERRRVQTVNAAFSRLHDVVPNELDYDSSPCYDEDNKSKRVSKVTTLKRAINYIKLLQRALSIDHQ